MNPHELSANVASNIKVYESQYIALFVASGFIEKFLKAFTVDCVNIYFSQSIDNYVFFL